MVVVPFVRARTFPRGVELAGAVSTGASSLVVTPRVSSLGLTTRLCQPRASESGCRAQRGPLVYLFVASARGGRLRLQLPRVCAGELLGIVKAVHAHRSRRALAAKRAASSASSAGGGPSKAKRPGLCGARS